MAKTYSAIKTVSDQIKNATTAASNTAAIVGGNLGDIVDKIQEVDGAKVPTTTTVNGKPLSGNISLDATDIGIAPDLADKVSKTATETIGGTKTFSVSPIIPTPDADMQAATKKYVDDTKATVDATLLNKADLVGGKIPSSQLPAYVDDVLEYANLAAFPATGEAGKIYVALDTNLTYRWSGTAYVEISKSLALGETSPTAYRGDRGKTAYDHSQATGNVHGTTAAQIPNAPAGTIAATTVQAAINELDAGRVQLETDLNVTTDKLTELESKIQEDEDGTLKVVDEGGNIAFKVDENGANARKFNICDENGSIVGAVDFEVLISLLAKQDQLVSGKNIATINGETILEGKDIKVSIGIEDDNLPTFTVVDEQKNVAFRIDQNGMNANKYNVLDNDGNVLGVIDGSFFGGIYKDDVVINEDYRVDGESVKAKVYALRETWRNKYVTSSSKTIYWDNVDGLDANNGTTSSTPVLTFAKVKELLADGDTLLIKRGSRITSVCNFGALNGIKIDVYGNISLPNPIFDNFVQLTGWEKVSGYTNIYREKRMYSASPNVAYKTYYMQCFIDGKRLGASITSDNSLANKISCMNYKTISTALTYLDAHPDDACWFGGFERTSDEPSWTSGEYYWYISLSDAPSNHTIEVSNNVAISLCNIEGCKFTDIRNINHRGGVGKDGWHVGRNTIMENCNSYDQPNYGMLLQGGSWYCINCKIVSKSGSVNTQFHYFGDNPTYDYGSEYAFIGCSVILDRDNVMGSQGFGGHYIDAHTQLVTKNIYVIDCRCEGVWRCVAGYKSECFYVKNLDIVDCEAVYSANKIVIDGVKGNIKANGATFVYIDNVGLISLKVRGAVLKYENKDAVVDNAFIVVNQSVASVNDCPLVAMFKDCKFIFEKTKGSAYNFIIPNASDMTFENCCFAVKSSAKQYITNTPAVDNIHFDDCSFFGIENNITFEDSVNKCTFGNVGEMGSNFSFVDKNIVKQLKF